MKTLSRYEQVIWLVAMLCLLGFRMAHLHGPLDEPSWRQAWCAYHARETWRRGPSNWLINYINFRGSNDTGAWTFPLYENVVGMAYRLIGRESLFVARLITLASYLAATYLLFRVAKEMFDHRVGMYSALAFFATPSGLFYSRAVHYEALLIALTHAFLLCGLHFLRKPSFGVWALGATAGITAALIKPTFIIWMGMGLLVWAWVREERNHVRSLSSVAALFLLPVAAALGHHFYRLHYEGSMINTPLFPDPYNPVYAKSWFLGTLQEKMNVNFWREIVRLTVWFICTPAGAVLALCSLGAWRRRDWRAGFLSWIGWCAGLGFYAVLFVRIVATHDYWRLPFMAPLALAMALGLITLLDWPRAQWLEFLRPMIILGVVALVGWGIPAAFRRGPHFQRDWQRIRAGEAIAGHTAPAELVLSSCIGRSTGPTDPRILNFADRKGWANRIEDLSPEMLRLYREEGATIVAVLVTPEHLPLSPTWAWMLDCPRQEVALQPPAEGAVLFYRLMECEL